MNNPSQLILRMKIINSSSDTLRNVRARYFLNNRANLVLKISPYYMEGATVSIDTLGDYLAVNIDMQKLAPGIFPNASGISLGINDTNYLDLRKSEHFSYPGAGNFAVTYSIPVSANGVVLVGSAPIEEEFPKLRFVGIQPENSNNRSAWVEIENYGETALNLDSILLKQKDSSLVSLKSINLPSHSRIRICSDSTLVCPSNQLNIANSSLQLDSIGEIVLLSGNRPIDYISWGEKGLMYDELFEYLESLDSFLSTSTEPMLGPVCVYQKGMFYRAFFNENKKRFWSLFNTTEIAKNENALPNIRPISLTENSRISLEPGDNMVFAWNKVSGAAKYDFIIVNADDSSEVEHRITNSTVISMRLKSGSYIWSVEALRENQAAGSFLSHLRNFVSNFKLTVTTASHLLASPNLHVTPLAARKDTYMLDLKWGDEIIKKRWDSPHNLSQYLDSNGQLQFSDSLEKNWDEEESWRCWIAAVVMLNHYNGGNLTEDEVKLKVKGNKSNLKLDAFPHGRHGCGYGSDINFALKWALNLSYADIHYYHGRPSELEILSALQNGRPVIIWQLDHLMVIDAALYNDDNEVEFRFINVDNNGHYEWRVYSTLDEISCCWMPEKTDNPLMSDSLKKIDSDLDGIVDYDELYRFGTEYLLEDSDGDLIKDKEEIMSYTLLEINPGFTRKNGVDGYYGVEYETMADVDNDGLRAEKDRDSDNDGLLDGQEDVNHNGLQEPGETSPYFGEDDSYVVSVNNITLYALNELKYNDGATCTNDSLENGYCDVASFADYKWNGYATVIGARAKVGNIFSKGNVFLRSYAHVYGTINLALTAHVNSLEKQSGVVVDGDVRSFTIPQWNFILPSAPKIYPYTVDADADRLVVSSNQHVVLQNGKTYSSVKVESGGELIIPAGEFWIGSIQLDAGSSLHFSNDRQSSIVHVCGSLIWQADMADNLDVIAKKFKIIQHAYDEKMYIDKNFGGTIVAPNSAVIIGQAQKVFYGTVLARDITVHQYATLFHVAFEQHLDNSFYAIDWRKK